MHKRDNQNIQILPGQLIRREISRLMVGESIPPNLNHTSDSSHTPSPQHPAWPRANFDPKLPATMALSLFLQLGTHTKVKHCSAQKGQYLPSGVGTICSLLSSPGNGCGWSSEKPSLCIKLVTYLQSPSLGERLMFCLPSKRSSPTGGSKRTRAWGGGEVMRVQRDAAAGNSGSCQAACREERASSEQHRCG